MFPPPRDSFALFTRPPRRVSGLMDCFPECTRREAGWHHDDPGTQKKSSPRSMSNEGLFASLLSHAQRWEMSVSKSKRKSSVYSFEASLNMRANGRECPLSSLKRNRFSISLSNSWESKERHGSKFKSMELEWRLLFFFTSFHTKCAFLIGMTRQSGLGFTLFIFIQ